MNTKKSKTTILAALVALVAGLATLAGCARMDVGYLKTDDASFSPHELSVYRIIDPESERARNGSPWSSSRIQGVSGTAPINYSYLSVRATDGGSAEAFDAVAKAGHLLIRGGLIQLFQKGVEQLPNGKYILTIKVSNEDHEAVLRDIFTIVVADRDPDYIE